MHFRETDCYGTVQATVSCEASESCWDLDVMDVSVIFHLRPVASLVLTNQPPSFISLQKTSVIEL